MLSLALLSYRGFWESGDVGRDSLAKAIARGLKGLEPLAGDWQLIWGPGTYRYLGSVFDSSMLFVVRHTKLEGRYAIVIRGTNPVSIIDWIFGDFLPHRQVPWFPAQAGNKRGPAVSLSAALGLKAILNMRAANVPEHIAEPGKYAALVELGAMLLSDVRGTGAAIFSVAEEIRGTRTVSAALDELQHLGAQLAGYQEQWARAMAFGREIAASVSVMPEREEMLRLVSLRRGLVKLLDESVEAVAEEPLAVLMPQPDNPLCEQNGDMTLLELLRQLAETHGESLELFLTGHSKGGMLAPGLAMFLSDTQAGGHCEIPEAYRWNSAGNAAIHCYAFAGPTPGNTAFAEHFNAELGANFFRYANTRDATTLLWQSEKMRDMPGLLDGAVPGLPGMEILANQMADEVENLDYVHPGKDYPHHGGVKHVVDKHVVEFSGRSPPTHSNWPREVIYQHLGAYIDVLGLDRFFDLQDLMGMGSGG